MLEHLKIIHPGPSVAIFVCQLVVRILLACLKRIVKLKFLLNLAVLFDINHVEVEGVDLTEAVIAANHQVLELLLERREDGLNFLAHLVLESKEL